MTEPFAERYDAAVQEMKLAARPTIELLEEWVKSVILRLRAAAHEIRCQECRVTWASWLGRILNIKSSWTPTTGEG